MGNKQTSNISIYEQTYPYRFWSKVDVKDPNYCWPWIAYVDPLGYGVVAKGDRKTVGRRTYRAHREAYRLHYGPIQEGMHVLHSCDNRRCCNPLHLFLGTHADNMADCAKKGRNKTSRPGNGVQKVLLHDHKDILELSASGQNNSQIARSFGVTPSAIRNIKKKYKQWENDQTSKETLETGTGRQKRP